MNPKLIEAINRDDVKQLGALRGDTPLRALLGHAVARGSKKCLAVLLAEPGAKQAVRAQGAVTLDTPLHLARTGPIAKALLDLGAGVHALTSKGETPLHRAASLGRADVVGVLLGAGAEVDAADAEGRTPLLAALRHSHVECVERLLAAGAKVDAPDRAGRLPLELLEAGGTAKARERLVALLLDAGADPTRALATSSAVRAVVAARARAKPSTARRERRAKGR